MRVGSVVTAFAGDANDAPVAEKTVAALEAVATLEKKLRLFEASAS
jgi:hypothetical protein